jgi:hypothetical protein
VTAGSGVLAVVLALAPGTVAARRTTTLTPPAERRRFFSTT